MGNRNSLSSGRLARTAATALSISTADSGSYGWVEAGTAVTKGLFLSSGSGSRSGCPAHPRPGGFAARASDFGPDSARSLERRTAMTDQTAPSRSQNPSAHGTVFNGLAAL